MKWWKQHNRGMFLLLQHLVYVFQTDTKNTMLFLLPWTTNCTRLLPDWFYNLFLQSGFLCWWLHLFFLRSLLFLRFWSRSLGRFLQSKAELFFNLENDLTPKQSSKQLHYNNWNFYIKINIIKHYLNRGLCMSALFFLSLLLLFLLFVLVFFLSWCAGCVMKWTINFSADLQFKTYSTSMYFLLWWWLII